MSEIVLTSAQRAFHQGLLEHPAAPRYNFTSTDMLTVERLAEVRAYERDFASAVFWKEGRHPDWLPDFVAQAFRTVPFYRVLGGVPRTFEAIPSFGREALQKEISSFVPDDLCLETMTAYTTSGTQGSVLPVPTHPTVSSLLLVVTEAMLAKAGVSYPRGPGATAVALVGYQQKTLTYASLSHHLEGAGFLKLNLAPHEWRSPEDRARFLRDTSPHVISGSPYAFEKLSEIVPDLRPAALVSSAVALHEGHARKLAETFQCPVFDMVSMTESRGIAGRLWQEESWELLSPDLYVEILGDNDEPLPSGEVGEIVLTGGRNPYLPLLRYRTGDRAALVFEKGRPYLRSFEGRQAVRLEHASGEVIPSLDVVNALRDFALVGFSLAQDKDRSVKISLCGKVDEREVRQALEELFATPVEMTAQPGWEGKPHRFRSQLEGPAF